MGDKPEEPQPITFKLKMGPRKIGHHIGKCDVGYIPRPNGALEDPTSLSAALKDPDFAKRPLYMWKEVDAETFSDDDETEDKGTGAFERPRIKARNRMQATHWVIEDNREPAMDRAAMKLVGDKTNQTSNYVLFDVVPGDDEEPSIRVIPVDEWWHFSRPRTEEKMTVNEALQKMKHQAMGYDMSGSNKRLAERMKHMETLNATDDVDEKETPAGGKGGGGGRGGGRGRPKFESPDDTEVVAMNAPEDDAIIDEGLEDREEPGRAANPTEEPGGEDSMDIEVAVEGADEKGIDFDEVFSDDDADIEDVYNAGEGLDDSDESGAEETKEGEVAGKKLLEKALDGTGAEEEDEEEDMSMNFASSAMQYVPSSLKPQPEPEADGATAMDTSQATPGNGKRRAGESPEFAKDAKRPREDVPPIPPVIAKTGGPGGVPARKQGAAAGDVITEEMVLFEMRRMGGRMDRKGLLNTFSKHLKMLESNKAIFKNLARKLLTLVDDPLVGKVYQLKDVYRS